MVFFAVVTLGRGQDGATDETRVVLQLPDEKGEHSAGYHAAEAQGYFREHGLVVEIRRGSPGRQPVGEVTRGSAQYGVVGPGLLVARLRGEPVVHLASIFQHSPIILAVRAETGIAMPAELAGKRIALDMHGSHPEIRAMLLAGGLGPDQFSPVLLPVQGDLSLAENVDAIVTTSCDAERRGGDWRQLRPADYGVDFYGDSLFTSETEAREHPLRAEAMRRAVVRGWQYVLDHPVESLSGPESSSEQVLLRQNREAAHTADLIDASLVAVGHTNHERWRRLAGLVVRSGLAVDTRKLEGFFFSTPVEAPPRWVGVLVGVLGALLALVVVVLLLNRRLKRLVERQTRELRLSEAIQREYFDLAPAPIVVESYLSLEIELARLRERGIADLRAHLLAERELRERLFRLKRVVAANRMALRRTGYKSVVDMDTNLRDVMTEQAMEMFVEELVAIWNGQDRLTLEKIYHNKNDEMIHTLVNWEVGRIGDIRDLGHVRLVFTDITQQKRTEKALRESEARYRHLFEQAPLAVIEIDYSGLGVWFEELRARGVTDLEDYLNTHPEERRTILVRAPLVNVNQSTLALFRASSKAEVMSRMAEVLTENAIKVRCDNAVRIWCGLLSTSGTIDLRRLDGVVRTLSFYWRMEADEQGRPTLQRTQTVLVDITEQLVAERALRESEARYREVFEQAVGGIFRSSPEGHLLAVNPALARMFGFRNPEEMIGWTRSNTLQELYLNPERRAEFFASLNQEGLVNDFESEVRHTCGEIIWVSENARAVKEPNGQLLYYEGFVTDITARRRLEAEMTRASKLEAVGILAGGIAHDFNNILTVVLGNLALAEMDSSPDNSIQLALGNAKKATMRARDLTMQLLTFAKGGDPIRQTIALPELLRETVDFVLHGSKSRGVFQIEEGLWPANADKAQVGQVIQNLVINAVQAMPEGGTVTIAAHNTRQELPPSLPAGRYVFLSVADTGIGVPAENLAKIFDPYFTTKKQGSGLGLATVYSIIRKHQGAIEVESTAGQGTVFRLWLPAAEKMPTESRPEPIATRPSLAARVLFMDDEQPIREMASAFLRRLGATCVLAADGGEAVRLYREASGTTLAFDAVVMDLTVPGGMGGSEALQQIRQIDPNVRAIVSSGYSQDPVLANHSAHGFKGILPKPYSFAQLTRALQDVLG